MPAGNAAPDGAEKAPVPTALIAAKLKVYSSPSVRPVTVHVVAVLVTDAWHTSVAAVEVVTLSSSRL